MRTARIDYSRGEYGITIFEGDRRVEMRWGTYREMVLYAAQAGVERGNVTLAPVAQDAALLTCLGWTP